MTTVEKKGSHLYLCSYVQMSPIDFNPQPFARMQIRFQFRKLLLRSILLRDEDIIFISVRRQFMEIILILSCGRAQVRE